MHSEFNRNSFRLFVFILLLIATSCNNESTGKKDDIQPVADTNKASDAGKRQPGAALIGGFLDTLVIDRGAFDTVNNGSQVVFSFIFGANDKPTLHGWIRKGNGFDSLPNWRPNWELKNANPGSVAYSNSTYFGNIVLLPQDFNKIKNALNNTHKTVVFAPYLFGNNIAYKVFLSTSPSFSKIEITALSPTGADANPSPPKTYN